MNTTDSMLKTLDSTNNAAASPAKKITPGYDQKKSIEKVFIKNSDDFVLLNVPVGEPNRHGAEPERVLWRSKPGSTTYYAAKRAAMFSEQDFVKRQMEKDRVAASKLRKARSQWRTLESNIKANMFALTKFLGVALDDKDTLYQFTKETIDELKLELSADAKQMARLKAQEDFLEKYKGSKVTNLATFLLLEYCNADSEACCTFLKDIGLDPLKEFNEKIESHSKIEKDPNRKKELPSNLPTMEEDSMQIIAKRNILNGCASTHLKRIFNLTCIEWKPTDKIDVLFDLLKKTQTSMVFAGYLGEDYYDEHTPDQLKLEQFEISVLKKEHYLHSKPVELRSYGDASSHVVNVIGVQKTSGEEQGYVYFLDPKDPSDPKIGVNKAYAMPYSQFCKGCLNIYHNLGNLNTNEYGLQRPRT